jgi:foldase protein PrsA
MSLSRSSTLLSLLACALTALAVAGCGGGSSASGPRDVPADAIAVVGDVTITKAQFQSLIDRAKKNYEQQKRAFPKPGTQAYESIKDQAVRYLVQQAEYQLEAKSLDVTVTDAQVEQRYDQIRTTSFGGSETKLEGALKQQGLTVSDAKDILRTRLIQDGIYAKITGSIRVTDDMVKTYYDQNKSQFTQQEKRKIRHILVKKKALADDLYQRLKSGADFGKLARKYSKDPGSAKKGGVLTVTKGQTVAPFDKVAFSLSVNELSKPVKTQFGWHIIQALGPIQPKSVTPLDQVKGQIKDQLLSERKQNALEMWSKELPTRYNSEIAYAPGFKPPGPPPGGSASP